LSSKYCRGFEGISTELKLSSMFFIITYTIFIECTEVLCWNIINEQTQIANSFAALLCELEVRVDVGFTPGTSEWPIHIFVINLRDAVKAIIDF
jgi:hypothetical protein